MKVTEEVQMKIQNLNKIFSASSFEKSGRESKQLTDLPTPHETVIEALKDLFANFKTTLIIAPLKRKLIQEVPLPGLSIKQIKTPTGLVQKTYLQNMDQTLQELPISTMAFSRAELTEAEGATAKEVGASGEARPVSGAFVSGESGEAISDKGFQSAPEPSTKKRYRRRNAPSDIRRKTKHVQKFQATEAKNDVFAAKFFNEW